MPTSHFKQIPDVISAVLEVNPRSIFEVGVGCGKYGVILREYLEVWDHYFEPWGSVKVDIDGCEIHEQYSDSPGWAAYRQIMIGDAVKIAPTLAGDSYDMGLLIDVLEHFPLNVGTDLMREMIRIAPRVVVALPTHFFETLEVWDNPHEVHHCAWTIADFEVIGHTKVHRHDDSTVVTITRR